jgi:hypothetical protein
MTISFISPPNKVMTFVNVNTSGFTWSLPSSYLNPKTGATTNVIPRGVTTIMYNGVQWVLLYQM